MASYYPIPFAIPAEDRIVAVMLQKLDCGNGCASRPTTECWCDYIVDDDEYTCSYCSSDHYRYNELIITTSSDKFDERPVYTCWIIKSGTTSITSPKNNEVFTVPGVYTRDSVHSFTIVMESFDFALTTDDSDIEVFRPHIDLLISITGCYTEVQRMNLRAKSMMLFGKHSKAGPGGGAGGVGGGAGGVGGVGGGAGGGKEDDDTRRKRIHMQRKMQGKKADASAPDVYTSPVVDARLTIEQMIMDNMTKTMRCDRSVYRTIQPIARTFANAIVHARAPRITKGECPHIGKAVRIKR
jgi:hypothetical protein